MPSRCSGAFISPGERFRGAVDFFLSALDARTRGGEEHLYADRQPRSEDSANPHDRTASGEGPEGEGTPRPFLNSDALHA